MKTIRVFKGRIALSAVFAVSALLAQNVQAASITSIGGSYVLGPQSGSTSSVTFAGAADGTGNGSISQLNGVTPVSGTATTLTMNLTNWTSNGGAVTVNPSSVTLTLSSGGDTVTFNLSNATLSSFGGGFAGLTADAAFQSAGGSWTNTTFQNFIDFGGTLKIALNNITSATPGNPGAAVIGTSATSAFTLKANEPPPAGVPEPASLALWGVIGMAGMWYGRRKMQRKLAV